MSSDPFPAQLYLLTPWELSIQKPLSDADKPRLCKALNQLLRSLNQPYPQAITILDQALANLDAGEIAPVELSATQTPLKAWEVEDFDQYFGVTHVQAQEPEMCLVISLLLVCRSFLILSHDHALDPTQVELQKQGFASYAALLARVFDLRLEQPE